MKNLRKYGKRPFLAALIHGGPGAAGEMAPVAMELSRFSGILEPLQTAATIQGQAEELKKVIEKNTAPPIVLIGFSWGAWLSYIFTSKYGSLVKKLVLVGSGPFEEKYARNIMAARMGRLNKEDREKVNLLSTRLNNPGLKNKNTALKEFGALMEKTDSYEPLKENHSGNKMIFREDIYEKIWNEASELRRSGALLKYGKAIRCPVFAIHGDYDPHPARGVIEPLTKLIKNFHHTILGKCGHKPWIERYARENFYYILNRLILNDPM